MSDCPKDDFPLLEKNHLENLMLADLKRARALIDAKKLKDIRKRHRFQIPSETHLLTCPLFPIY